MRTSWSRVVGVMIAGSMAIGSVGVALGQSPSPSAEASPAPETAITSELGVEQITQAQTANDRPQGKTYRKTLAKAAPAIAGYIAKGGDTAPAERVIANVLKAREADEAGDTKAAKAYVALATAIYRATWTADGTGPTELDTEIERVVGESYARQEGLSLRAPDGFVGVGIHEVVGDKTAGDKLNGPKYSTAIRKAAPDIVRYLAAGTEAEPAELVIENVLKAREADEVGDTKAAKAYMALAAAVYRAAWSPRGGWTPAGLNREITRLVSENHPDEPGLRLTAPEGQRDICHFSKKQRKKRGQIDFTLDHAAPWSCAEVGGKALRVDEDEVSPVSDGIEGRHEVGTPVLIAVGQDENAVRLDRVLDIVRLRGPRKPGPGSDYYGNVVDESCFGNVGDYPTITPIINDRSSKQRGPMGDTLALAEYPAGIRVKNMTFTGTTCVVDGTRYRIYAGGAE